MASREEREAQARARRQARKEELKAKREGRHGDGADFFGEGAGDARSELLSDAKPMTQEEIARADKRSNQAILDSTIKAAAEAQAIGEYTATKLNEQAEQMKRVDNDLKETDASLQRSERVMRSMKSFGGKRRNVFSKAPKKQEEEEKPKFNEWDPSKQSSALSSSSSSSPHEDEKDEGYDEIEGLELKDDPEELEAKAAQRRALQPKAAPVRAVPPLRDEQDRYLPREEDSQVMMQGPLSLLEISYGMFKKVKTNWKPCYFVANQDYLFGYPSEQAALANEIPTIKILLRGCSFENYSDLQHNKPCTFGVTDPAVAEENKTIVLAAADTGERRQWQDAIKMDARKALLGKGHAKKVSTNGNGVRLQDRDDLTAEEMRELFNQEKREEDKQLAQLGGLMDHLLVQGHALNKSLKEQNAAINHVSGNMDQVHGRMERATGTANSFLK